MKVTTDLHLVPRLRIPTPMRFEMLLELAFPYLTLKLLLIEDYGIRNFQIKFCTEMLQMLEPFFSKYSLAGKIIVQ
jgi:hypothetical protein